MGTKLNPGKFDCFSKMEDDEPFFVLRAKDRQAPALVLRWAAERALQCAVDGLYPDELEKIRESLELCEAMTRWRINNVY